MTADKVYRKLDTTINSQHGIVLNESNLKSQGYLIAVVHIYFFLSNFITSLSLNLLAPEFGI